MDFICKILDFYLLFIFYYTQNNKNNYSKKTNLIEISVSLGCATVDG